MYNYCKKYIQSGAYDKADLLKKMDLFLLMDRITIEEYSELKNLMEENEKPEHQDNHEVQEEQKEG